MTNDHAEWVERRKARKWHALGEEALWGCLSLCIGVIATIILLATFWIGYWSVLLALPFLLVLRFTIRYTRQWSAVARRNGYVSVYEKYRRYHS